MRPIKFRAWDKDRGLMFIPYSIIQPKNKNSKDGLKIYVDECVYGTMKPRRNVEIMQFTGLHDKNGREIFEGDIVKRWQLWPGHNFAELKRKPTVEDLIDFVETKGNPYFDKSTNEVKFDEEKAGFYRVCKNWFSTWSIGGSNHAGGEIIEIIGNIYEHSHLLDNK